jgi:hypothetical protein
MSIIVYLQSHGMRTSPSPCFLLVPYLNNGV